jgi:pyruvate kinase
MSVARINMAHASYDFCLSAIQNLRSYLQTSRSTAQVAIWLDLNGPKVRYFHNDLFMVERVNWPMVNLYGWKKEVNSALSMIAPLLGIILE